jgi:apolipoprotein D and lipocalin family protein
MTRYLTTDSAAMQSLPQRARRSLPLLALVLLTAMTACTRVPEGLQPVTGFDVNRYVGKWYEIARLDHSFERGLQNVSAEYTLKPDGDIAVLNRGYNTEEKQWDEEEGNARFVGDPHVGSLKVSFFGPFYGGYHVLALDHDYHYAMLTGPSRKYLWILSRQETLPEDVLQGLLHQAKVWGFDTDKIIRVSHAPPAEPAASADAVAPATANSPAQSPAPAKP